MTEKVCNLWVEPAEYRCVLTSGAVASDGTALMDSGSAMEAKKKFANIELDLGRALTSRGNHVQVLRPKLLSFPIKQYEWSGPDINVIERSARELLEIVKEAITLIPCPVGPDDAISWEDVAKRLAFLPDNIIIVKSA